MTKDFYFNTAAELDKAKADRDKLVTPVEYKPAIPNVGADANMLWPDTMYGLLPRGTGKITLLESNPSTWVMRITADRRIEVNEDVEVTEAAQKVLDAMRCLLAALPAQRQWTGLTDEEMDELVDRFARYELVRATENLLRSKNV